MKALRALLIASLSVALGAAVGARAASTTDFTDQWWVVSESGWGASIHQQSDTLVVNLLVYGMDGRPTWLVAATALQAGASGGHTVFTGDLYATTGPYYGVVVFDAASVSLRKVGTLTFDASSAANATISYSVDGTPVAKNVTRHTGDYENLSGSYYAVWSYDGCYGPSRFSEALDVKILHNPDNTVAMECWSRDNMGGFYFGGTYSQTGHLGQIAGQVLPPDRGSYTFTEIDATDTGFTARVEGVINNCQAKNGQIAAIRR
jgi:hypothetical protein